MRFQFAPRLFGFEFQNLYVPFLKRKYPKWCAFIFQTLLMRGSLHSESISMRKVQSCFSKFFIFHLKNSQFLRYGQFRDLHKFDIQLVWTQNSTVRRQRFLADVELFLEPLRPGREVHFKLTRKSVAWPAPQTQFPRRGTLPCLALLASPRSPLQEQVCSYTAALPGARTGFSNKGGGCSVVTFRAWVLSGRTWPVQTGSRFCSDFLKFLP